MVAFAASFDPLARRIPARSCDSARHRSAGRVMSAELRVRAEREMALIERLALCARWPAKSSVRELVLRVEALLLQVLGPLGELRPVARGEVRVALHVREAASRISMLPLSSTGIWFSSVRSPPP